MCCPTSFLLPPGLQETRRKILPVLDQDYLKIIGR